MDKVPYFLIFFQIFKYNWFIVPHLYFNSSKSEEMFYFYRIDFFVFYIFLFPEEEAFFNYYTIIFND